MEQGDAQAEKYEQDAGTNCVLSGREALRVDDVIDARVALPRPRKVSCPGPGHLRAAGGGFFLAGAAG